MRPSRRRLGVLSLCAVLLPQACGSSDKKKVPFAEDAGGGAGGEGGTGEGGTGDTLQCGTASCASVTVSGMTLVGCCPAGTSNRCGLDVSEAAAALLGLAGGCVELEQAGPDDPACPALGAPANVPGVPSEFQGCCRTGSCGARIDLSDAFGVDFGCIDTSTLPDAGAPVSCGAAGTGGQGGSSGADGGAAGESGGGLGGAGGEGGAVEPMCSATDPCTWHQLSPTDSPPVLAWAAMAYDAARDQIILFGGAPTINGGTLTDRTWAWNGSNWTELFPVDKPSARWTHGMVYDELRERIVLFGGQSTDQPGSGLDDTWEWDGSNWIPVTTADAPDPRGVHGAMAYDSDRDLVVLRGGATLPGQTIFADTWEYDGSNWVEVAGTGPDQRVAPALAFDKARGQMILFGGGTWSPYFEDTWSYDGGSWSPLTPPDHPTPRQSARMVYDHTRSLLLLFGGGNDSLLNDLYEWDGSNWALVPVTGPPPRCCYAYAHDLERRTTLLFGGSDDQTWAYGQEP